MTLSLIDDLLYDVQHHQVPDERGPKLALSKELHREKYRTEGESFREAMTRISSTLSDGEEHFREFRECLLDVRFMPAGRVQAAIGSTRQVTAMNCFVSGIINDNFVSGIETGSFFKDGGIMARAVEATQTMRMGGGIGYDFSTIRPKKDLISSQETLASGPVSFMQIFDAICKTIAAAGHRRGAQMGVLRIDHPDVEEFIHAKQNNYNLKGFNISLAVTDEFMKAVRDDKIFDLQWGGRVYKTVQARILWDQIMRATWDFAEPGVLFIDTINKMNNLWFCEIIAASNPCSEQVLPPYGACLLGSFALTSYIDTTDAWFNQEGKMRGYKFNYEQFLSDIPLVVRAMDNVIDNTIYPLREQEKEAKNKRRMGLGITGLANALEALGHSYGSTRFIRMERKILRTLMNETYRASALLAKEKGAFPLYNKELYNRGKFIKILDKDVRELILKHGIRNSHLTSIAPTGTISLCADNISSGLEPVFRHSYSRAILNFDGPTTELVEDFGVREFGILGKTADQCSVEDHLNVLIEAQKWVDSAISKTCNVPASTPWEDFKNIYFRAWEKGCKGCTTFNSGGKREGVLKEVTQEGEACSFDPETGRKTCE